MGWGVSRLVGLKVAFHFLIFVYLRVLGFTLLSVPFLYASLVLLLISIASHPGINLPLLLGKRADGTFPIWSLIMFSPFLYFVRTFSALRRFLSKEAPYSEICDGVFVGGWPYSREILPPGNPAIVDCTCELPRRSKLSDNAYFCIPIWDTRSPQPAEIQSAVRWACMKRAQKAPVFIHCAHGHGRSVVVMCALLVALGVAEDWKDAEKVIQERRPCIQMNALHRKALEEWTSLRLCDHKRTRETDIDHLPRRSHEEPFPCYGSTQHQQTYPPALHLLKPQHVKDSL